jgi:serine/threonine protein kinase
VDPDRIVGTDIAGYTVESVLGRGAMGVVYVARQR